MQSSTGERGVGKTSLANVLSSYLEPFTSETIASARVNCYGRDNVHADMNSLFRQVGFPTKGEYEPLTLDDVLDTLRKEDARKLILIVDEFDRIQDPDIDTLFADTIKTLSDFDVDTTLILVGVADDVDDLITEHESINRCLVQIHLPRMTVEELEAIINFGIETVGMQISHEAVSQICSVSLGAAQLRSCPGTGGRTRGNRQKKSENRHRGCGRGHQGAGTGVAADGHTSLRPGDCQSAKAELLLPGSLSLLVSADRSTGLLSRRRHPLYVLTDHGARPGHPIVCTAPARTVRG